MPATCWPATCSTRWSGFGSADGWSVDLDNDVIRGVTVLEAGEVLARPAPTLTPASQGSRAAPDACPGQARGPRGLGALHVWGVVVALFLVMFMVLADDAPEFAPSRSLCCLLHRLAVIWNVTPAPPPDGDTNAIGGIVGGMLQVGAASWFAAVLGFAAIFFASINVFGGFAVTHRMLAMFHKEAS